MTDAPAPHVGLFVTCLVDLMRPAVGFAAVKLLEEAGCRVSVPDAQTCCGQPAFNSGDLPDARALAKLAIAACEPYDYVVLPSGSCCGMFRKYPQLLADDPRWRDRAAALAARTFELLSFLHDVLKTPAAGARLDGRLTYHDSCSGLRELGIKRQPRDLLAGVAGLELVEMVDAEVCCGFGGSFCVKYPDISGRMVDDKAGNVVATGADYLAGGDLGCLLNIAGRLRRRGSAVKVYHAAEVLAGITDAPPVGEDPA